MRSTLERLPRRPGILIVLLALVLAAVLGYQTTDETAGPREREAAAGRAARTLPAAPPAGDRIEGLPPEAYETLELIEAGGPFPYRQDGSVFRNREGRLPARPQGYYREYTVPTPGEDDRGARRIVRGRDGDTWYTPDHYETFVRVDRAPPS